MAHWIIKSKATGIQLGSKTFDLQEDATTWITQMGPVLAQMYFAEYQHSDPKIRKLINEGLVKADLESILLSRVSVDEYTSADPNSSNITVAFFIKGVPEAIMPFKNFIEKCNGVLEVDYSDCETIPNCSVVYVEFDRENKRKIKDIHDMLIQVGMLAALKIDEFSLSFPNSNKKFPYSAELLSRYFSMRSKRINQIAQKQALIAKTKELQDEIKDEIKKATAHKAAQLAGQSGKVPQSDMHKPESKPNVSAKQDNDLVKQAEHAATESLINRLTSLMG